MRAGTSAPEKSGGAHPRFAALGTCRGSLREAHRILAVDLEIRVLTRAGGGRIEVAAERVDRIRLPEADGYRVVLRREELPPLDTGRAPPATCSASIEKNFSGSVIRCCTTTSIVATSLIGPTSDSTPDVAQKQRDQPADPAPLDHSPSQSLKR